MISSSRVGADLEGEAAERIDAAGLLVAPGFVDIHTHYDGQATWDPVLDPSASHAVTTVVAGNCGVGFAPVRPGQENWLVELMEGVEDIPGTALHEGIQWEWESVPEYLDALGRREYALDIAVFMPHAPLRVDVMGERGAKNEDATEAEEVSLAGVFGHHEVAFGDHLVCSCVRVACLPAARRSVRTTKHLDTATPHGFGSPGSGDVDCVRKVTS